MLTDAARHVKGPRGAEVWLLQPSDVPAADAGEVGVLDVDERRRLERLQRPEERQAFTCAHLLLRELLASRLGAPAADIQFVRRPCPRCGGPHGRPAVAWPSAEAPVEFSLSRSSGLIVVGLADVPIGVDAEAIGDERTAMSVSGLLSAAERARVQDAPAAQRPLVFTRLWARKEAYLKAVGIGIAAEHALAEPGPAEIGGVGGAVGTPAGAVGAPGGAGGAIGAPGGTGGPGGAAAGVAPGAAAGVGGAGWAVSEVDAGPGYVAAIALWAGANPGSSQPPAPPPPRRR